MMSYAQLDSIIVGSGGGFSGKVTSYKITGRCVFKANGLISPPYKEATRLKRKKKKYIFRTAEQLWKQQQGFEHPSNMYKFMTLYSGGKSKHFTWGDPSFPVPDNIGRCYEGILSVLAALKFNSK